MWKVRPTRASLRQFVGTRHSRHMRTAAALLVLVTCFSMVGCAGVIPVPVPETPTAAAAVSAPRPAPSPPSDLAEVPASLGLCGHEDFGRVATFVAHFNASDGRHYHGWQPPVGDIYWVEC